MKRATLGVCFWAAITTVAPAADEQAGITVFEAEAFATNLSPRGGHAWVVSNAVAGFSGTGYVEATPNDGANINADWMNTSPELQYPVNFTLSGARTVWVRAYATNGTDDSVHAGLDGATNTANAITLAANQLNGWHWTSLRASLPAATVTGGPGSHTFSLWMREDGMRVDRVLLAANPNLVPIIGNSWHIPDNPEPSIGIPGMRIPLRGMGPDTAVHVYSGNQFQGDGGNPADQAQTGSFIYYKHADATDWTPLQLWFHAEAGNNKYYTGTIPGGTFAPGDIVQYYLRLNYTDRLPTFLYGHDSLSQATELESVAQANPFTYEVAWPLEPAGPWLAITNASDTGLVEARVYTDSGHLVVRGAGLDGQPLTQAVTLAPPGARVGGEWYRIGRVLDAAAIAEGLELRQRLAGTSVVARLTFAADAVARYAVVDWGGLAVSETELVAPSDSSEHFYGFGEKFNDFDQAGRRVHMLTRDQFFPKGDRSYKVAPWFVSTRGYGLHLDSTAESWFDMRAQHADRYVVSCLLPELKVNLVYGPRLTDVLRRHTGYSGRPPLSPPWVFAPWMSSDVWRTGGEVRYVVTRYREYGIPGSVLVFDSPWEVGYNDFTWNMTQFGNAGTYEDIVWPGFASLAEMMTFLRAHGFKAVCWMTPFINTSSVNDGVGGQNLGQAANYAEAAASNYFVRASPGGPPLSVNWWKGTGSPVDFTHPGARAWFTAQLSNLVAESGGVIGGFKTDDGESGSSDGNMYIPTNAIYYDGRTGLEMRNGFCVDYHRTVWHVLGTNGTLFARSGFTGSQAYPAGWAGDNQPNFGEEGIQGVVIAGQSAAMSGISIWSHDICGYDDAPGRWSSTPANLFMRWTQFGALSPIMQMHRQIDSGRQYPWSFGAAALENYARWAHLHTALFPYLYTYAREAAETGLPILRPLVLMDQTDPNTYSLRHTYLLGNELLVAVIITNNAVARTVYLPPGNWCDFFTHQVHAGGQHIAWANPDQSETPLFVRQGALIPMLPNAVDTLCDAAYVGNTNIVTWDDGALAFWVYPGTNTSFTLYDGTAAACASNGTIVTLALTAAPRPIAWQVLAAEPFSVERDGVALPRFTHAADLAQARHGWRYEAPFVHIEITHAGGDTEIAFGPDSVGDGISDSWRARFFGDAAATNALSCATCDPDGDGATNADEFRTGTDPTDAASVLRISQLDGPNRLLTWHSTPGHRYVVLGSTNLFAFTPISGVITATTATTHYTDTNAILRQYYRVAAIVE